MRVSLPVRFAAHSAHRNGPHTVCNCVRQLALRQVDQVDQVGTKWAAPNTRWPFAHFCRRSARPLTSCGFSSCSSFAPCLLADNSLQLCGPTQFQPALRAAHWLGRLSVHWEKMLPQNSGEKSGEKVSSECAQLRILLQIRRQILKQILKQIVHSEKWSHWLAASTEKSPPFKSLLPLLSSATA